MKHIAFFIAFVMLFACSTKMETKNKELTENFKTSIHEYFPAIYDQMCQESEEYARKCFQVTEDECKQITNDSIKKCFAQYDDQIEITDKETGGNWGKKIGGCIGKLYEDKLTSEGKRILSEECKDPSKFVNKERTLKYMEKVFDDLENN